MSAPARPLAPAVVRTPTVPVSLPSRAPSRLLQRRCACGGSEGLQGECEECRKKKLLQRRAGNTAGPVPVPPVVHEVLGGAGRPLDPATRGSMESGFGRDFSAVRIHDDARAGASARAVGADAYTVGQDIVFAPGRYSPGSGAGRELLAHELAHTVQQAGFQRHADPAAIGLAAPAEDARLEAEADRAAARVVAGLPAGGGLDGSAGLRLSRQEESPGRDWTVDNRQTVRLDREVTAPGRGSTPVNRRDRDYEIDRMQFGPGTRAGSVPRTVALRVAPFYLPASKGDVLDAWNQVLRAGALRAVFQTAGRGAALSQSRAPTGRDPINTPGGPIAGNANSNLRGNWLLGKGWPADRLDCVGKLWQRISGNPGPGATVTDDSRFPRLRAGATCDLDHIVELQVGGTNIPNNLQVHDSALNSESGNTIQTQFSRLISQANEELWPDPNQRPEEITFEFTRIQRVGGTVNHCPANACAGITPAAPATQCWMVECCARQLQASVGSTIPTVCGAAATGTGTPAVALQPYPVTAGGQSATLMVPARQPGREVAVPLSPVRSGQDTPVPAVAENRAGSELIAGLLLTRLRLTRGTGNPRDEIRGEIDRRAFEGGPGGRDGRGETSLPREVDNQAGGIDLIAEAPAAAGDPRRIRFARPTQSLSFIYPFLSPVSLRVRQTDQGLAGEGELRPTLPLLNRAPLQVEFGNNRMRAFYGTNAAGRLRSPIPGLRFTEASIGVEMLPAFRPSGVLAFEIGPARRPIATGRLEASADANGLVFLGTLDAHIPGTDQARGEVAYRAGQWSGSIVVNSSQIRLPGVQRGEIRVDFTDRGIVPSGTVDLLVAGQPVTLTVSYRNGNVLFAGRGRFAVPGLDPVEADVESDGTNVSFSARTGFTVRSLRGTGTIRYRNGRWSGDGTIAVNRGRASGTLNVQFSEAGRIHGDGRLTYRITDNLTASLGVLLREDQSVRVSGDITLATIQLFPRLPRDGGRQRLFRFPRISIPIAGISLGPLGDAGLVARIDSEIGVYYGIGPGELRNTRLTTQFDPLADNPNFEFTAGTELFVPMRAGFYLQVDGSVALSAVIASISGGLTVTGEAGLEGSFTANAQLRYAQRRFELQARAALLAQPRFVLGIDARVRAEAGVGPFSTSAEKVWNLARFSWGSNLQFGLAVPFRYASDQPFQMPSFADIEWIYPRNIDFEDVVRSLVGRAGR